MMSLSKPLRLILVAGLAGAAQADSAGLYFTLDGWDVDSSGRIGDTRSSMQDFSLGSDNKVSFAVNLEHSMPLVPNLRIRHNDLSSSGTTTLDTNFNFGSESFAISTQVATDFSFQDTDVTLYYQVFDNEVVSFDLGLTGRWLDGEFKVRDLAGTQNASESFKGVVPMLYGALQIGVPATGLSFFGELSAVNLDDNSLQDYQAGLAYNFQDGPGIGLAVRAGYREYSLELDDVDNVFADWTFDGPFLGLQAHF